jgi:hypothetical protein
MGSDAMQSDVQMLADMLDRHASRLAWLRQRYAFRKLPRPST